MSTKNIEKEDNENITLKQNEVPNKKSVLEALKTEFATTVNRVYINSIDKEVDFREISVSEQKTLARIMIDNKSKNRKDIAVEAQLALLQKICLDDTIDIYSLKEFDRLKLLMAVYQSNLFKNNINFTCEHCGAENAYTLDFSQAMSKLDEIALDEKTFEYENKNFKYTFVIEYPTIKKVLAFYKSYNKKFVKGAIQQQKVMDDMSNMEYVNLYIKNVTLKNKATGNIIDVNMNEQLVEDIEGILELFPQDVLYSDDGVLFYIMNNFIKVINDAFDEQRCYNCGEVYENTVRSAQSFF